MLRSLSRFRSTLRALPQTLISHHSPATPFSPLILRTPPDLQNPSLPPPLSLLSSPFSSKRKKSGDDKEEDDDDAGLGVFVFGRDPNSAPRLVVIQPRLRPDALLNSKLSEALNLANSLEEQRDGLYADDFAAKDPPPHIVVQNPAARSGTHADTYFGKGTVENVKCHIRMLESEKGIDAVFVNAILSGIQQRNLEVSWGKPVLDRVGLIIEIFNAHAETKEAKLQSELAALMYKKSRLVRVRGPGGKLTFGASGEAEVVSARGRGSGGQGFVSGAGETELQLQRRRILERRGRLLAEIEEVRRTRALQRSSRRRHGGSQGRGLATVAVVGYTNAGKSTLVSTLSESDLYSDDRLFATVDPRLRSVILPSGRKTLLSDTVGFISDLPIQLVEAFHATLEEVVEADLLVHVLDSSAQNLEEQRSTVLQVLQQIGVSEEKIANMIEVWNKIDLLEKDEGDEIVDEDKCLDEGEDDRIIGDDSCLDEDEHEENRDEDDMSLPSYDESIGDDGSDMVSELSAGAELETSDCQATETKSATVPELTDVQSVRTSELETSDCQATETKSATLSESIDVQSVRTSAVTGVGLQELLYLIDEKLNTLNSSENKTTGHFDRKWRPSYTANDEEVAEQ